MTTWLEHVNKWKDCQRCPLGQQRDRICFARACLAGDPPGSYGGSLPADVCLIGEAPGISEDASGLPFYGPAGDLLSRIVTAALPADVPVIYTNLVLCFPREAKLRGDNEPERSEILECRPRLIEFVNLVQPKLVVCVGSLADQFIRPIGKTELLHIIHPAHILKMPPAKKPFEVQKCVVQIRNAYEEVVASNKPFERWVNHAESKPQSKKQQIKQTYRDAGVSTNLPYDESDIPF